MKFVLKNWKKTENKNTLANKQDWKNADWEVE